ncbi:hypothetical protein ACE7GA_24240 [Roseomonas sp. CCTCC AB2023176]|uniref:hypothetical protein n=1 Tax=Roseomonas sp. CCTCC AB2023176 TaxID=3342640 RepID=UPI0035DA9F6D
MADIVALPGEGPRARDAGRITPAGLAPEGPGLILPQVPAATVRRGWGLRSFLLLVVLPTVLGAVYFLAVAAPQYVTTAVFALRVGDELDLTPARGGGSLVGAFGPPTGGSTTTQSHGLARYLASAPALQDAIGHGVDVRRILTSPLADPLVRVPADAGPDRLLRAWQSMVHAQYEVTSGVITLRTHAFTPADSLALAEATLATSERLANHISARAHSDALRQAEADLGLAERQVSVVRAQLHALRTETGVLDASRSTASSVEIETRLRTDLMTAEGQAEGLRVSGATGTPAYAAAMARIRALRTQLGEMERQSGRTTQRDGAGLAAVLDRHEALAAEMRMAETRHAQAMNALTEARANAVRQGTYILPFVRPVEASEAAYPDPARTILLVAGCSFLVWIAAVLLFHAVRDHA